MVLAAHSWHCASARRTLLALACLLTFALQNFVAQTHIHPLQGIPGITSLKPLPVAPHSGAPGQPANDTSDSDCSICQQAHAGQHVAPGGPILFAPMLAVGTIETVFGRLPPFKTASHSWRGRGPPQH